MTTEMTTEVSLESGQSPTTNYVTIDARPKDRHVALAEAVKFHSAAEHYAKPEDVVETAKFFEYYLQHGECVQG